MKALTILQPWAWLIVQGGKNIENRTWSTGHRGPLLIHAGKRPDPEAILHVMSSYHPVTLRKVPAYANYPTDLSGFQFGGVIGIVDVVDVVAVPAGEWWQGPFGWVLDKPRALPFLPYRGQQGLFDVPDWLVKL
jgi:hypothetical protein